MESRNSILKKIFVFILLVSLNSNVSCRSDNNAERSLKKTTGKDQLIKRDEIRFKNKIEEAEYYAKLGESLLDERLNEGLLLIEKAHNLEPGNLEVLFKLGKAYNMKANDFLHNLYGEEKSKIEQGQSIKNKAYVIFKKIVEEHMKSNLAEEAQFMLGVYYSDPITVWDNNYEKAIFEYRKVLKNYPNSLKSPVAQYNIASCYIPLKNYEIAIDEYKKVIKNYPKSEEAALSQNAIGACYEFGLKDYTRAIEEYEKTIKNYPETKEAEGALIDIARIYNEGLHNYTKAIEIYDYYLKVYPKGIFEDLAKSELKKLK